MHFFTIINIQYLKIVKTLYPSSPISIIQNTYKIYTIHIKIIFYYQITSHYNSSLSTYFSKLLQYFSNAFSRLNHQHPIFKNRENYSEKLFYNRIILYFAHRHFILLHLFQLFKIYIKIIFFSKLLQYFSNAFSRLNHQYPIFKNRENYSKKLFYTFHTNTLPPSTYFNYSKYI